MTRREKIEYLRKEEKEGNEEIIALLDIICLCIPQILNNPESATEKDIVIFNELVSGNIIDTNLRNKLTMDK